MNMITSKLSAFAVLAFLGSALLFTGCDSNSALEGSGAPTLSLSIHVPTSTAAAAGKTASGYILTDGVNTLEITSVGIVLREIELEGQFGDDCDAVENESTGDNIDEDDDCEEFEVGPILLEPILDGTVDHLVEVEIPLGTYDELEVKVHKVSGDEPESEAFLLLHPEYDGLSVRVTGTYNGDPFLFEQDVNEELELDLDPPLEITGASIDGNITVNIDIATWFRTGTGDLVNPETANVGGENEGFVEENIKNSIEAFEDHDEDGDDDDDD